MTVVATCWHHKFAFNQLWPRTILSLFGGLLLAVPHVSADWYALSWVALIPLLVAIRGVTLTQSYFLGFIYGIGLYTGGAFWIVDFLNLFKNYHGVENYLFSSLFWLYCAQLPACLAFSYKWLSRESKLPSAILFPAITVFYFACFPVLFSAQLGETQSHFITAIQAIEFLGVYGLDFVIALVNITLFNLLFNTMSKKHLTLVLAALSVWFAYGIYANQYWENVMQQWPTMRIGIVQPNEPPKITVNNMLPGYSRAFSPEIDMTERLATAGAKLIVWPEAKYKDYLNSQQVSEAYKHTVSRLNVNLIFQDMEKLKVLKNNQVLSQEYNAAVMINHLGEQQPVYRKQKRVPFGEYVPYISDMPILRQKVEGFFGDFLNEINKGHGPVTFSVGNLKFIPLICYETMFADFVANAVPDNAKGSILVGLSSNGWFGDSIQPYQHVFSSSLRAVENRLPMIHALNNGPSAVVLPNGRFLFTSDYHQAGGYLVDLPYSESSGGSVFSQYPWVMLYFIYIILLIAIWQKIRNTYF